ncbi:hypothetical protein LY76DRAFT_594219 [Colletotrichum caudatum]|nr:hypothetical protein LY76DRAFT_594219 [Colletotrichum caudatum]
MAAWGDNVDVLINLIKLGLSIQEKDSGGTTALGALWVESCSAEQVVNLMRFLALTHSLEDCLSSPFQRMDFSSGGEVVGSEASTWYLMTNAAWMIPGVLQILATEFQVDRLQLPPISRFASLRWLFVDPDVILDEISLGGGWDAASLGSMLGGPDDNNLDAFAKAYFFGVQALNYWPLDPCERDFGKEPKIESWRRLARWILPAASLEVLIHPSRGNGFLDRSSPFFSGLRFLYSHFIYFEMKKREWRRRMSRAVVMWLEDVRSSGIDLDEYGAAVRKQYLENAWLKTGEWEISEDRGPRLVDLTVGPMPEDWKLHLDWDFDDEEFAGEFWETVENPPLHIPGGWVDE